MALPHHHRLNTMARIHPTYTPARILQLLDDRAALLQRLIEHADTLGELADLEAAAAEIRFIRLELTDPTRPIAPAAPADVDIHTMEPTA